MSKRSAGLLLYRIVEGNPEVFLVHPGGPFWSGKDTSAWSIPKGEVVPGEDELATARRELLEETGIEVEASFIPLTPVRQAGGKTVAAWAVKAEFDNAAVTCSSTFSIEWPPRSKRFREFPEIDRAEWFPVQEALKRILKGQQPLLHELLALLGESGEI